VRTIEDTHVKGMKNFPQDIKSYYKEYNESTKYKANLEAGPNPPGWAVYRTAEENGISSTVIIK
jgi:hypothetical protein